MWAGVSSLYVLGRAFCAVGGLRCHFGIARWIVQCMRTSLAEHVEEVKGRLFFPILRSEAHSSPSQAASHCAAVLL